mmetsp:Transcript_73872/g.153918  ORF Transcript_73872/g.153918 Transcript_73872/m.153918 type:complete len:240 (-) Transcript_73872:65-784(-)
MKHLTHHLGADHLHSGNFDLEDLHQIGTTTTPSLSLSPSPSLDATFTLGGSSGSRARAASYRHFLDGHPTSFLVGMSKCAWSPGYDAIMLTKKDRRWPDNPAEALWPAALKEFRQYEGEAGSGRFGPPGPKGGWLDGAPKNPWQHLDCAYLPWSRRCGWRGPEDYPPGMRVPPPDPRYPRPVYRWPGPLEDPNTNQRNGALLSTGEVFEVDAQQALEQGQSAYPTPGDEPFRGAKPAMA